MLGAKSFEELDAYRLAVQLRREVIKRSGPDRIAHDFRFVGQLRNAARGGPRNISEGFSRCNPKEFANFLSYAKASLDETKNHVTDGFESGYFTKKEHELLITLLKRTLAAINRFMEYLESPEAMRNYKALRERRAQRRAQRQKAKGRTAEPRTPRTGEP